MKHLIEHIETLYKELKNPWLISDEIAHALRKKGQSYKAESVGRKMRLHRDKFQELKVGNYKKFKLLEEQPTLL
ncbi:MAG: hypothetical protein DRJ69_06865 [Thermoprotei archaeon]|nr:MAG: hypothetical protein DRJ69_06865 [Thermoprotei archaeon]